MKFNKKLIPIILFICIFPSMLFTSCTKQGTKTVVMQDNLSDSNSSEGTNFHSGKVYKFNYFNVIDNKPVNEMSFGWLDKDNTAAVVDKQDDYLTIEAVNYKYHFSKEIMKVTSDISSYSVSPDGKKISYVKGEKLFIKDIQDNKDKEIGQLQMTKRSSANISWSGNNRFVVCTVSSYPAGIEQVYIYDNTGGNMHKIGLKPAGAPTAPTPQLIPMEPHNYNVMISDDGTKLLINSLYDYGDYKTEYLMHLYNLNEKTFALEKELETNYSNMVNSCFISNDRLIYVNVRNSSLDIYNTVTGENIEVYKLDKANMNQCFRVSNDGKSIVFIKHLQDGTPGIYEAGIQNDKLVDERMIYQGFLPNNIRWSVDDKKVLLSGRYTYGERIDKTRQQDPSYVSLGNVIIELN